LNGNKKTLQEIVGFFGYKVTRGWEFSNQFVSDIMLLAGICTQHDKTRPENDPILCAIQNRKGV
jgi:hypothetical protein